MRPPSDGGLKIDYYIFISRLLFTAGKYRSLTHTFARIQKIFVEVYLILLAFRVYTFLIFCVTCELNNTLLSILLSTMSQSIQFMNVPIKPRR